jgi:hypothetical protein
MFKCIRCSKEFKYNYLLVRHNNRKNICTQEKKIYLRINNNSDIIDNSDIIKNNKDVEIEIHNKFKKSNNKINIIDKKIEILNDDIIKIENELEINMELCIQNKKCNHCDKIFSKQYNLIRHITNICFFVIKLNDRKNKLLDEKKNLMDEKNNLIMKIENENLRKMVLDLLKKRSPNINITNINNNNNNNNNKVINNNLNVQINSFGNESLTHITNNDYKKFLSGFFPGFIKFIEKVHFDDNVPENHNISITNLKSKYIHIYDNDKWMSKEKNETIDTFIAKKYNILANKLDELEENNIIDEKVIEKFNRFTQNYQDKEAQKNTKNDIIMMIYNNKNKIKEKK